jgi:Domain of Unknown Function (DUF1080)
MRYSSLHSRWLWLLCLLASPGFSQTTLPLTDLSAFRPTEPNWRVAGSASASPTLANALSAATGTGVLVNMPAKPAYGSQYNLLTKLEHGDLDLDFDFMMARGSNSGVYLQGRYEVQLFDSWGVKSPKTYDVGSIYERWDERQPDGKKGYDGHPARQNASRAPGLWQHLKISFQAPRFDASGKKTENARMIRVELNGVMIQEDVELSGPTRGPAFDNEAVTGPIMIQGDHGPVAFRNIRYVNYDKPRPELRDLTYSVFKGRIEKETDMAGLKAPEAQGASLVLSSTVSRIPNDFLIRYTGTLRVAEPGEYKFNLGVPGGGGVLRINNQPVIARAEWGGQGKASLPKGDLPFELLYSKFVDWVKPGLGLAVSGPGVREFVISDQNAGDGDVTDPILIDAAQQPILRSFMDLPGVMNPQGKPFRVVHAVSVGDAAEAVHYTYDMDNGALVQLWRGQFLDATPMWHDRGDGSSRPLGMTQLFGKPALTLARLATPDAAWPTDTTGSGYRPKGYAFDETDRPTFRYVLGGATVEDQIRPLAGGQGISRTLSVSGGTATGLMARLAAGNAITMQENGLYAIDGQYFVQAEGAMVRTVGGQQELVMPVAGKISYSILF